MSPQDTRQARVEAKRREVERVYRILRALGIAAPYHAESWLVDEIMSMDVPSLADFDPKP